MRSGELSTCVPGFGPAGSTLATQYVEVSTPPVRDLLVKDDAVPAASRVLRESGAITDDGASCN